MTTPSPDSSAKRTSATARKKAETAQSEPSTVREDAVVTSAKVDAESETDVAAAHMPETTDETNEAPVPVQRAYGYWLLLLFVVFAGSLVSLAWYGWSLFQANATQINHVLMAQKADQTALDQALQTAQSRLDRLSAATHSAQDRAAGQREQMQSAQQKLVQRVDNLDRHYAQIEDRLGRGELAWHVAEIGFLLTRAEERLSVAHDPAGAAVALTLADKRLATLSRPEALSVRSAISEALAQLQKVEAFDRVGMALTLRRSADEVTGWPLMGAEQAAQPHNDATAQATPEVGQTPAESPWYVRWPRVVWQPAAAWLDRQFTLTRSDAPLKASARASTDRETLIWLTAVREALLARDSRSLAESIHQAETWITSHYAEQAPAVARALKALQQIRTFYASRTLPDLAPVFKAWRASGLAETTMEIPAPAVTETHP